MVRNLTASVLHKMVTVFNIRINIMAKYNVRNEQAFTIGKRENYKT